MALSTRSMPMNWIQRYSEVIFALMLVIVVMMFIIPLPTFLLDFLLSFNIAFGLTVLLVSISTKEPLEFSVFPSLLLFATLFRLALNVSTTRLILGKADAGKIIFAFGDFVVGGNYVVGFIIFLILVVIQFIVITKGAERVAEVAARFTLDAMPGKQMSIDADLSAGLITEAEARVARKKIRQEADFYGAMDGASKFVKGDAIAGIVITLINVVGGLIIGIWQMGMAIDEALTTYALLTVGDGLVSQIPALLLATATGMVVTRASSEENLGKDMSRQLLAKPTVLLVTAVILLVLGFTPGLPAVPFLGLGLALGAYGFIASRQMKLMEAKQALVSDEPQETEMTGVLYKEDFKDIIWVDPIEMEVGYNLISLVLPEQGGDFLQRVTHIRRQLAMELGIIIPVVRIVDNMKIDANTYIIKLKGIEAARFKMIPNHYLAMDAEGMAEDIKGVETVEPAFGLPALWIPANMQEQAEVGGYTVVDQASIMATHLTEVLRNNAAKLLGRKEVRDIIEILKDDNNPVVNELIPDQMTLGEIQKILQFLLEEGVPVRDLTTILETIADWIRTTRDPIILTEYVRQALGRQITNQYQKDGVIYALTLSPQIEAELSESITQTEHSSYLNMEPFKLNKIIGTVAEKVSLLRKEGRRPVILTGSLVRFHLQRLLNRSQKVVSVLSYNEIDQEVEVRSLGVIRVDNTG